MDRATRKANLKKLQLPSTSGSKPQQRKTRQTSKSSTTTNTAITNYFLTPEKQSTNHIEDLKDCDSTKISPINKKPRGKRTKLDAFIFKDHNDIPEDIKNARKSSNDDDLVVPEKKAKKAPKLAITGSQAKASKTTRSKKQTTIKSAFLRNEQLFAEIAAQHCAADQFDGDDVQLALAISKSEAESKGIRLENDNEGEADINLVDGNKIEAESIREKLKKYGFRTAEKNDYNTFAAAFLPKTHGRRPKSKWANKFTALTLRKPENQLKKLHENIEKLLNSQFRTKSLSAQESFLPPYKLLSTLLKKCDMNENKRLLQTIKNDNQPNDQYFVTELFEINNLPAGHLLKDWNAIQGRDLTPNVKSKQTMESLKKLQNIYQELEEYFNSKKRLNWSIDNEDNHEQEEMVTFTKDNEENKKKEFEASLNTGETSNDNENLELNKMVDLIQDLQRNETVIDLESNSCSPKCDNKIIKLLPSSKSLDIMQVSSCSVNTQATINSTQKQRSNSPDLFADSDIEMEEEKTEVQTVINVGKKRSRNDSIEDLEAGGVTTYEIFSSDEVKNTSSSKPNKSVAQEEISTSESAELANDHQIIDLTQDDVELSKHNQTNHNLNQSKNIVEIDIFAESPTQAEEEENVSKYLPEKEETFKHSLTSETNDKEPNFLDNNKEETFELSLSLQTQQVSNEKTKNNRNEDSFEFSLTPERHEPYPQIKIHKIRESFELSLCPENKELYKKVTETNTMEDSIYLSLSSKILEAEENKDKSLRLSFSLETPQEFKETSKSNNQMQEDDDDMVLREIAMDQTNTSFLNFQGSKQLETCFHKETAIVEKEEKFKDNLTGNDTIFRELCNKYLKESTITSSSNKLQKTDLNKSFSQILPAIKTPPKSDNFTQFTMDFDVTVDNSLTLKRKSMSFTAKTPTKIDIKYSNKKLSKSHSFNNSNMENNSIDLTQNDEDKKMELDEEEDDDCLVLSDDEINYSIWQANKTENFKTSEQSDHEDVFSLTDNEEIKNVCKEIIVDTNTSLTKNFLQDEESYSDFEILTSKYASPKSTSQEDLKFDRSEFGILEEYSQPVNYTPNLCTPTKYLNEASFLSSPTETTAPMKRYSNYHRSSQKFQDLLNNINDKSPSPKDSYATDVNNDFDEFDRLVYTSPFKTKTPIKNPQGIEQLLTAEISFKETPKTPKANKSSKVTTPLKPFTIETQEVKCNNKSYIVRSVTSPKPDYTKYSEAELLKELYNFGIKPLKRKQAVKMLEYIYNQTHPILMEEEDEEIIKAKDLQDIDGPSTSKASLSANAKLKEPNDNLVIFANESEKVAANVIMNGGDKKLNLQDSCGWEMLRYSLDLKAELLDEQYILQTNVTKKTFQPLLPFHIAWYNLVCSNRKLHETILMYEPIDLQEIYLFLKGLGYRYDPKDLKIFFDRRCIIFRYDLTSATNSNGKTKDINRHVRKSKKSKISKK